MAFFRDLLDAIVTTVHSLKIDLASLNLSYNGLKSLPDHFFEGLNNLQELYLNNNILSNLPEHIFEGLGICKSLSFTIMNWRVCLNISLKV